MEKDRKDFLLTLIKWYWGKANPDFILRKEDYEFLYTIYNSGISVYDKDIQARLNKIRDIYIYDQKKDTR